MTRANYPSKDGGTPTGACAHRGLLLVLVGACDKVRSRGLVGTAKFPQFWTGFDPAACQYLEVGCYDKSVLWRVLTELLGESHPNFLPLTLRFAVAPLS